MSKGTAEVVDGLAADLGSAEVAHVREAGWAGTHHRDPETGERMVGTADGLGFGVDDSWHNPVEVIPWSELEAIAREVPAEVREQLVEFRDRWREHQSAYPRFTASAAAVGCGPIAAGEPLTERQEAYMREHEAFEASGVLPAWEQQRAELDGERLGLHGQAMGLSAGSDAGDLLELLADQPVDQAVSSGRPALLPPTPSPSGFDDAAAPSTGNASRPRGVGR